MQNPAVSQQRDPAASRAVRLHYLDWLRVIATLGVFLFHASNVFNTAKFEIKNAEVSEIKFKVAGDWTRFLEVKLNFADGTSQALNSDIDVEPGNSSEAFTIDGGPKALASIDVSCKAASASRTGRATIKVVGQ